MAHAEYPNPTAHGRRNDVCDGMTQNHGLLQYEDGEEYAELVFHCVPDKRRAQGINRKRIPLFTNVINVVTIVIKNSNGHSVASRLLKIKTGSSEHSLRIPPQR